MKLALHAAAVMAWHVMMTAMLTASCVGHTSMQMAKTIPLTPTS